MAKQLSEIQVMTDNGIETLAIPTGGGRCFVGNFLKTTTGRNSLELVINTSEEVFTIDIMQFDSSNSCVVFEIMTQNERVNGHILSELASRTSKWINIFKNTKASRAQEYFIDSTPDYQILLAGLADDDQDAIVSSGYLVSAKYTYQLHVIWRASLTNTVLKGTMQATILEFKNH